VHHGGVVTSYMGDGVMALFGGDDGPSSSQRAARAGVEMLARAERRRGELEQLYGRAFDVNVGLHSGPAIVGRLWCSPPTITAIGDTVNLAARVEHANRDLATRFLTTDETSTGCTRVFSSGDRSVSPCPVWRASRGSSSPRCLLTAHGRESWARPGAVQCHCAARSAVAS
jgi:class 3 adenylate cyclase